MGETAKPHSEECRARIEKEMGEDPRSIRVRERMDEFYARTLEKTDEDRRRKAGKKDSEALWNKDEEKTGEKDCEMGVPTTPGLAEGQAKDSMVVDQTGAAAWPSRSRDASQPAGDASQPAGKGGRRSEKTGSRIATER